jgi:hypothetical protein
MPLNLQGNIISTDDITSVGVFKTKVNRDGLVCYLDSNDKNSYPGSGTVWYDLSGNNNHGTMTRMNSPSAGNTSGFDTTTGYMMFDRHLGATDATANNVVVINNSASIDECSCENGMTMELWVNETSTVCTALTKWNGTWEIYYCSSLTFRTQGTGGSDGTSSFSSSPGNWRQIVATHNGILRKIFVNGVEGLNSINIVTGQDYSNNLSVGAYEDGTYSCIASMPIYRLYNRELSPYEIAENFQANRDRFGI